MDTVEAFELAAELASEKLMTAIHKHYTVDEWGAFLNSQPDSSINTLPYVRALVKRMKTKSL